MKIFSLSFFLISNYLFGQTLDETIDLIVDNYLEAGGWFMHERLASMLEDDSNTYFSVNGFTETSPQLHTKRIGNLNIQAFTNEMYHNWTMRIGISKHSYEYFADKIISKIYAHGVNGTMHQIQDGLQWIDEIDPNVVTVAFREKPNESINGFVSIEISVMQYNEQFSKILKSNMEH
jgi:hypothetical protein